MYVVGVIGHKRYPVIYNRARLTPLFGNLVGRPYPKVHGNATGILKFNLGKGEFH